MLLLNNMKKILTLCAVLMLAVSNSYAGDGDTFLNVSGGWQLNSQRLKSNIVNAVIGMEFEGKYHNAWEVYVDLSTAYEKCPVHGKVDSKSFWSYKTFGIGGAYKPAFIRGKNSNVRWRFGTDIGANENSFQASVDIGIEYSYTFKNGMQILVMQKNDFVFWSRDHFRNGVLVGVKFPLSR